jgi:hypothetical protein
MNELLILLLTVDTTICDEVKDLRDDSGNYLTTVCLAVHCTYYEANKQCQSHGMSFFNANTSEDIKALLDFSDTRFKPLSGDFLYIQGKTNENCSVLYNGDDKGLFIVSAFPCYNRSLFYCQYTRTPITVELGKKKDENQN